MNLSEYEKILRLPREKRAELADECGRLMALTESRDLKRAIGHVRIAALSPRQLAGADALLCDPRQQSLVVVCDRAALADLAPARRAQIARSLEVLEDREIRVRVKWDATGWWLCGDEAVVSWG